MLNTRTLTFKKQVSLTSRCHNHRPYTKPLHHEEETQDTNSDRAARTQCRSRTAVIFCVFFQGAIVAIKKINKPSITIHKPLLLEIKRVGHLTHLCWIYYPILINWTSPFPILGLLGRIFHFYSNFKRNFCKQTVENLIRRPFVFAVSDLVCTDFRCSAKRTLGLYEITILA